MIIKKYYKVNLNVYFVVYFKNEFWIPIASKKRNMNLKALVWKFICFSRGMSFFFIKPKTISLHYPLSLVSLNSMRESKTHWTPGRESNDFLNKYFLGKCTIAIGDSDNGIITTLYSGSNGVCNPSYQLSSLVRLQNNFVELNLTRDESWYEGLQTPLDPE